MSPFISGVRVLLFSCCGRVLQVVEKTSSGSEEDINDKRKLKELEAAVVSLQRTQAFYLKSFVDLSANAAAFHVDLANVYPAGEMLSTSVMQVRRRGGSFGQFFFFLVFVLGLQQPANRLWEQRYGRAPLSASMLHSALPRPRLARLCPCLVFFHLFIAAERVGRRLQGRACHSGADPGGVCQARC